MGSKYPVLPSSDVVSALKKLGFTFKSQRGSHVKYVCSGRTVIVPMHNELAKGTLKSILEQAGVDLDTFLKQL